MFTAITSHLRSKRNVLVFVNPSHVIIELERNDIMRRYKENKFEVIEWLHATYNIAIVDARHVLEREYCEEVYKCTL
jgi:hypothetical protein